MGLDEIAQQAMDYLDSVGVAADWKISKPNHLDKEKLDIIIDDRVISIFGVDGGDFLFHRLSMIHPQKSPE